MKLPYFKIKEAFEDAKDSFAYGSGTDKLSSTAKLLGKSVANIGMFAVEIGTEVVKNLPEATGKKAQELLDKNADSMSEEQIEKAKRAIELGKEAKERRLEKERQERERKRQEQEESQ
jgi:hypothetical protein